MEASIQHKIQNAFDMYLPIFQVWQMTVYKHCLSTRCTLMVHLIQETEMTYNAAACLNPAFGIISHALFNKHGFSTYYMPDYTRTWEFRMSKPYTQNSQVRRDRIIMQLKTKVCTKSRSSRMKQEMHPCLTEQGGWSWAKSCAKVKGRCSGGRLAQSPICSLYNLGKFK